MWVVPIRFSAADSSVTFDTQAGPVPLPPWSGVPVAMAMEVDRATLQSALRIQREGILRARDEEGDPIACAAMIDPDGCHTCETDTVLMLVSAGRSSPMRSKNRLWTCMKPCLAALLWRLMPRFEKSRRHARQQHGACVYPRATIPRLAQVVEHMNDDLELQQLWKCANITAVQRLEHDRPWPVHIRS